LGDRDHDQGDEEPGALASCTKSMVHTFVPFQVLEQISA
jgi:hypothetical protein